MVINDNTPARKVLSDAFQYIKNNWKKSKADILRLVLELQLDGEGLDSDKSTEKK